MSSTSKACPKSGAKMKAADLERIRNNQRRCRSRRKDYIRELEEKIRRYESSGSQILIDTKLQQLIKENESLKRLLQSMGLGDHFLQAYSKASEMTPEISRAQLGDEGCCQTEGCSSLDNMQAKSSPNVTPGLQPLNTLLAVELDSEASSQDPLQFLHSPLQTEALLPWEFSFGFSTIPTDFSGSLQTEIQTQTLVESAAYAPIADALGSMIPSETTENTTLCSLAFSLVMRNNRKAYTATDLDLKLRAGYRCGLTASEGCRVDNKILFSVLAEIS